MIGFVLLVGDEGRKNLALLGANPGLEPTSIRNQIKSLWLFLQFLVEQEGSILRTKSLEDRLKSIITEINEETDYWYYLHEPAYNRYLISRE